MGGVEAAERRHGRGDFRHLVLRRGACRRVEQARGQADGACLHRLDEAALHGGDLAVARRPVERVHGVVAQHGMAYLHGGVDRGAGALDGRHVAGDIVEIEIAVRADEVERRRRLGALAQRRDGDAAIARDHRRHALAGLRRHAGVVDQIAVVMGVGV